MEYEIELLPPKKRRDGSLISDIKSRERNLALIDQGRDIFEVTSVSQKVERGNFPTWALPAQKVHQIAAYKSCGSGYENLHGNSVTVDKYYN
jgi:hypothetical protein